MDCQAQVLIKGAEGKWLLVESASGRLLVPGSRLRETEDFIAAAQRCLLEVCSANLRYFSTNLARPYISLFPSSIRTYCGGTRMLG